MLTRSLCIPVQPETGESDKPTSKVKTNHSETETTLSGGFHCTVYYLDFNLLLMDFKINNLWSQALNAQKANKNAYIF